MRLTGFDVEKVIIVFRTAFPLPMKTPGTVNRRRYSGLLYVVRGGIRFTVNGQEMIARERDIVYLPEQCCYSYRASKDISTMQIEFDLIDVGTGRKLFFSSVPLLACRDTPEEIVNHFSSVIKSFAINDISAKIDRTCQLLQLFKFIAQSDSDSSTDEVKKKLAPALYRLREGYCEKVYTKELAVLCNVSESQLRRLFKETYGVSPITYKNNLRIKMACSLLEADEYSVSEIADILGFEDIYAFSHAFKKAMDISPSEYNAT